MVMYACFGLIHLLHTESTRNETPRQLSQRGVRLHVNWVNAEWDSMSTESTQSETPCQLSRRGMRLPVNWVNAKWDSTSTESTQKAPTFTKISSFCVDSVDMDSHSALTQSTCSLTWRWLSWRGMRLGVNWVTAECKKNPICWRIKVQNRKHSKALFLAYTCLISVKNRN